MHSQRASSTFCWLPPDSSRICCSGPAHLMPRRLMKRSTISLLAASSTMPRRDQVRQQRQREVLAHRHVGDDALDLAVLGAEARCRPGWRPRGEANRACSPSDGGCSPRSGRSAPNNGARRLRAARAEQPGEPDDLAPAQRRQSTPSSTRVARRRSRASRTVGPDRRPRTVPTCRPRRSDSVELAPEHGDDQLEPGQLGHRRDCHGAAVAHDGDAVADRVELVELVADEDDRDAVALSWRMTSNSTATSRSSSEEVGSSMMTSLASNDDRAGDRHHLLDGGRIARPAGADVDVDVEARRSRCRASRCIACQSSRPKRRCSRPRKMFSVTER